MSARRKKKKKSPASYKHRTYRKWIDADGLISFVVKVRETDLHILATEDMTDEATRLVLQYRAQLEKYIEEHPRFLASLAPLPNDPRAPGIVKKMIDAADAADVGPMAAVAGAVAECVGRDLLSAGAGEIMVENGGDIFLARKKECRIAIFAGASPLSNTIGVRIAKARMPLGVCASSGTVGHSLSLGQADSVTVLAESVCLADALATRLGNEINDHKGISRALEIAQTVPGIQGVVIIRDEKIGVWGDIELLPL
ncbi:MAG: UPF0280 family protein [Desulfobulbaceae bacterium]|nr:UPF0280 family protein [Desulfobulbaceae bacterium]